jgi:prepilin-type N-terminal cleavage/methylation domain-containing protein
MPIQLVTFPPLLPRIGRGGETARPVSISFQAYYAFPGNGTAPAPFRAISWSNPTIYGEIRMIRSLKLRKGVGVRERAARGFTLLELLVVIAIASILAAMAVPGFVNTLRVYRMRSAVSSITGLISNARYQAIFHGCKTQIVFTASTYTYQISSEQPAYGGQACLTAYSPVTAVLPLMGQGIAINQTVTFTFSPGGNVSSTPAMVPMTMNLSYPGFITSVPSEQITVSTYGNVTVAP